MSQIPEIHPGEILKEEFMKPKNLSQYRLAKETGIPVARINQIVLGKRSISANTALRLAKYFGNTAEFWMNLQMKYDLDRERGNIFNADRDNNGKGLSVDDFLKHL